MTMYEMNFSLLVEDTLKNIVLPEYRQIIVEVNGPNAIKAHRRKRIRINEDNLNHIKFVWIFNQHNTDFAPFIVEKSHISV